MNNENIIGKLEKVKDLKIVVLGDYCLDKYIYSTPEEDDISVETGKTAWQIYQKRMAAGAAGTITNNLCALGAHVICVGFAGDDGEGYEMKKELGKLNTNVSYMITTDKLVTPTYLKTMRLCDGGYREDLRFDFRNRYPAGETLAKKLIENFEKAAAMADGVVISDQFYERDTGTVSDYVRKNINIIAARLEIPILVDSRAFASEYKNMYVKCNNFELMNYCGVGGDPESSDDIIAGSRKLKELTGKPVFITRNKDGILINDKEIQEVSAYPVHGEIDVTGAGDASNAGIIIGLSLGLTPAESAEIACAVSNITIHKLGETGTATIEQITELMKGKK